MKSFGCDFFWPWVGGVPWGEGAREECWCDYDRSVYGFPRRFSSAAVDSFLPRWSSPDSQEESPSPKLKDLDSCCEVTCWCR